MSDSDEGEGLIDLPLPIFRDEFRSFFDEYRRDSAKQSIFPMSVTWKICKKHIQPIKVGKRTINTLSFADIHFSAKERYGSEVILYPSSDATLTTWKTVQILRPDYTERQDKLCAMIWAAHIGDLKALRKMLSFGSYLDRQTLNGNTVLMEALAGQTEYRYKCMELLLQSGARINLENEDGHNILTAIAFLNDMAALQLLHQKKNLKFIVNHKTWSGSTALSIAVAKKHFDIARFLVTECEADLLIEDNYQMTAACWAQVYCPPMAGYLCLKMGLTKELEKFVLRRNEILRELSLRARQNKSNEGDRELFSVIYGLTVLLLMLEPSRRIVVNKGMLNILTYHPLWDSVLEEGDDVLDSQIIQLLPWFVGLGCSMLYDESATLESFIRSGAAKRLVYGLNDMVMDVEDESESRVMVQALVTPLIANEYGRKWLYKVAFECTRILRHFLDEDDYLEENSAAVRRAFTMLMEANFRPYKMRENYQYLGAHAVKSLCPEPKMTVGEKLREAMAYFEEVKNEAKTWKAAEFMENFLKMEEKRKRQKEEQLIKARMRKMKSREKKKFMKQQEKQATTDAMGGGEKPRKKELVGESPSKSNVKVDGEVIDGECQQNDGEKLIALREAEDMYSPNKEAPKKKPVKQKPQKRPVTLDIGVGNTQGSSATWSSAAQRESTSRTRANSAQYYSPNKNASSQINNTRPKSRQETAENKKNQQKSRNNVKTPVSGPPQLMDLTFPKLPGSKSDDLPPAPPQLMNIPVPNRPETSEFKAEPKQPEKCWRPLEVSQKTEKSGARNDAQFPPLIPANAITVTQLEKMQREEEWPPKQLVEHKELSFFYQPDVQNKKQNDDPQISDNSNQSKQEKTCPSEITAGNVPSSSSSASSCNQSNPVADLPFVGNINPSSNAWLMNMNNNQQPVLKPGAAGDQGANDKSEEPLMNWIPRSKRWRVLFEHLVLLPAEKREKVGSIHFSFKDESLYIARGSNGTVVSIGLRDDGMEVAVKRLLKSNFRCIKNELENLRIPELEHENIVKYRDYVEDENFGYLALELCECTLEDYVHELRHTKTLHKKAHKLIWQMLRGLDVLHKAKILHMDIKPRNVLIDVRGNVRLADFGISHRMEDDQSTVYHAGALGTRCWRPRETIIGHKSGQHPPYKKNSDVQVAGMVAYYVMTGGLHPYGQDPSTVELAIGRGIPKFRDVHDETLINLMAWMLHPEVDKRKSAAECLSHPFFWTDSKRFAFLYKVSQEPEFRDRSRQSRVRNMIDSAGLWLKMGDWRSEIDQFFLGPEMSLQNYSSTLSELIRLMADVEDNFNTIAVHLRTLMGDPGNYFLVKFPKVFIVVYEIIRESDLRHRRSLTDFFDTNNYLQD